MSSLWGTNNRLGIVSLPKEWQDYDLKKDSVHWISNLQRFRKFLESNEKEQRAPFRESNNNNLNHSFDTILDTNDSEDTTIVFLNLELTTPFTTTTTTHPDDETNNNHETIQIRLNRDSKEISRRAFQRLEISVAKKLTPGGKTKNTKKNKKHKTRKEADKGDTAPEPSSRLLVCETKTETKDSEIDTETIDNIGLCKELASVAESSTFIELEVTMPLKPPTKEKNNGDNNEIASNLLPLTTNFRFGVDSNLPVILATQTFESFRSKLFVGIPIVVQTTLLHATGVEVSWFLSSSENDEAEEEEEELVLRNSHSFVPEANHVGKCLRVVLRPVRGDGQHQRYGRPEAYKFRNTIEQLPSMPIVSPLREPFIQEKATNNNDKFSSETPLLRVCTYNILADLYVSRKGTTGGDTTYPHVLYEHVEKTRRIPMIVAELLAYQADIICLQEVDGSVYDAYLQPIMKVSGYDGYYSNKASSQKEGCAMFWSTKVFEVDRELSFDVKNLFEPSGTEGFENDWSLSMKSIEQLLESHLELKKAVTEKLGQVLQIARLKLKYPTQGQPEAVIVANTHLFWHPMADHVRAMQAFAVAKKVDEIRRGQKNAFPDPFLLCGDLNSDPLSGASQLLTNRAIQSDHHDCWNYLHSYQMDVDDNDVEAMVESGTTAEERRSSHQKEIDKSITGNTPPPELSLADSFPHLVSGCQPNPPFTNFSLKFVETLDYVLVSQASEKDGFGFLPRRSAPMPSIKDVEEFVSMPNEFMPSDHVSIVCDLEWGRWDDQSPERG